MTTEDALFPEPERRGYQVGDVVEMQTVWGPEKGTVVAVTTVDGWPAIVLDMERGDRITTTGVGLLRRQQ